MRRGAMLRGLRAAAVFAAALVGQRSVWAGGPGLWSTLEHNEHNEKLRPMSQPEYDDPASLSLTQLMMGNRPNVRGSGSALIQEGSADRLLLSTKRDEDEKSALLQKVTLPPDFWMWKTTPAPPPIPGPNPQLVWVPHTKAPGATSPPAYENCYGCDCLIVYNLDVVQGGSIPDKYTCHGGAPTVTVPKFSWVGVPENSGQGHPIRAPDGSECLKSQSFAVTMQDLDYPYGTGQSQNRVKDMLWMVNIPGDWTEIDDAMAHQTYKDKPVVVIGRNEKGTLGMEPPCPQWGVHRYAFTLWALKDYLGTENNPVDSNTPSSAIHALLEEKELARYVFYGTVGAKGYHPKSFLQQFQAWTGLSR